MSDKKINIIYKLIDQTKAGFASISKSLDEVASKTKKTDSAFSEMTKKMMTFGATFLSLSFAKDAISKFEAVEQSILKLQAVLKVTGRGEELGGIEHLNDVAKNIKKATGISTVDTRDAMALLATQTNIAAGNFDRVTSIAADLSQLMGTDMQSSARMLTKALIGDEESMAAMARGGLKVNKATIEQYQQLLKNGKAYEAQNFLLESIEKKSKGVAAAMMTPIKQVKADISSATTTIGKAIVEDLINPIILGMKDAFGSQPINKLASSIIEFVSNSKTEISEFASYISGAFIGAINGASKYFDYTLARIKETIKLKNALAMMDAKTLIEEEKLTLVIRERNKLVRSGDFKAAKELEEVGLKKIIEHWSDFDKIIHNYNIELNKIKFIKMDYAWVNKLVEGFSKVSSWIGDVIKGAGKILSYIPGLSKLGTVIGRAFSFASKAFAPMDVAFRTIQAIVDILKGSYKAALIDVGLILIDLFVEPLNLAMKLTGWLIEKATGKKIEFFSSLDKQIASVKELKQAYIDTAVANKKTADAQSKLAELKSPKAVKERKDNKAKTDAKAALINANKKKENKDNARKQKALDDKKAAEEAAKAEADRIKSALKEYGSYYKQYIVNNTKEDQNYLEFVKSKYGKILFTLNKNQKDQIRKLYEEDRDYAIYIEGLKLDGKRLLNEDEFNATKNANDELHKNSKASIDKRVEDTKKAYKTFTSWFSGVYGRDYLKADDKTQKAALEAYVAVDKKKKKNLEDYVKWFKGTYGKDLLDAEEDIQEKAEKIYGELTDKQKDKWNNFLGWFLNTFKVSFVNASEDIQNAGQEAFSGDDLKRKWEAFADYYKNNLGKTIKDATKTQLDDAYKTWEDGLNDIKSATQEAVEGFFEAPADGKVAAFFKPFLDTANKAASTFVNSMFNPTDALGSGLTGALTGGITSIFTGLFNTLFGPEFQSKTVAEYAEEAFDDMVDNTNKALDKIGKEETLVGKQVDLLEKMKKAGEKLTVEKAVGMGVDPLMAIEAGTDIVKLQKLLLEREKQIQQDKIDLQRKDVTFMEGKIADVGGVAANELERIALRNKLQSDNGDFMGSGSADAIRYAELERSLRDVKDKYGLSTTEAYNTPALLSTLKDQLATLKIDFYTNASENLGKVLDLTKEIKDLKPDTSKNMKLLESVSNPDASVNTPVGGISVQSLSTPSTSIIANATKITADASGMTTNAEIFLKSIDQKLSSGRSAVVLTDNGKQLSEAIFYLIQDAQKNGSLPSF